MPLPATLVQASGAVHISYQDAYEDLRYATKVAGTWRLELVDDAAGTGAFTSIALDTDGYVHIGYMDLFRGDLRYARTLAPANGTDDDCDGVIR